jgi:predicted RNase H-like HicB family nuclease
MTETDLWHWIATLKVAHRPSAGLYSVWVDDPRGLHVTGQSLEEALSKAAQALEAAGQSQAGTTATVATSNTSSASQPDSSPASWHPSGR